MSKREDICAKRHKGNPESVEAFNSLHNRALYDMEKTLLNIIHLRGLYGATSDELEFLLDLKHQSVSARLSVLKKKGLLVPSVHRRRTRSGRNARRAPRPGQGHRNSSGWRGCGTRRYGSS